jgi:hypothetical protein
MTADVAGILVVLVVLGVLWPFAYLHLFPVAVAVVGALAWYL